MKKHTNIIQLILEYKKIHKHKNIQTNTKEQIKIIQRKYNKYETIQEHTQKYKQLKWKTHKHANS